MKHVAPRAFRLAVLPAACAALMSVCIPAMGQVSGGGAPTHSPHAAFERFDTNRDGFLSRAEVESMGVQSHAVHVEATSTSFHRLDVNGDGFLSRAEAQSTLAAVPGASFDAWDLDRNGFLSLAEAEPHLRWLARRSAASGPSFEALDTNRDGFLSRAEAEPLLASRQGPGGAYTNEPLFSFDRLDGDRDGFLSRSEAAPAINSTTFDQYDRNRDGFLSRAEADTLLRAGTGVTGVTPYGAVYGPR